MRSLHIRIPPELAEALGARAKELGIPVAALARNALLRMFGLSTTAVVGGDSASNGVALEEEPPGIGWQSVLLSVNAVCDSCNEFLPRGAKAVLAIPDSPYTRVLLCETCFGALDEASEDA
jgi:hypothetical protein